MNDPLAAVMSPSGGKNLRRVLALFVVGLMSLATTAPAATPEFSVRWQQGALMVGRITPGTTIRFGGHRVVADEQGRFALGLGYDAPATVVLDVVSGSEPAIRHEYAVDQRQYDVQKIGGLPPAMVEPPADVATRIEDDQRRVGEARTFDTPRPEFASAFRWPVAAEVTGVYGSNRILNDVPRQPHFGIDLAAPQGTKVHAAAGGIVRLADADLYYTGGTIILDHGRGVTTTYLHLSKLDVVVGQDVRQGDVIGRVGKTGRATGPHLCWRANWFDVRLDASLLMQTQPAKKGEIKK
ncbi:MAG: M23 family metallopeptidase [Panacagrimonas sp.]